MVGCLDALFACFFPAVLWAIHLEQEQISVTKQPLQGSSATFTCKVFGGSNNTYIHWYRARAGEAPHRLLYLTLSGSELKREAGFSSDKFLAYARESTCILLVYKLEETDNGHYYCATWDFTQCHKFPATLHKNRHSSVCGAQLSYYCCSRAG
ncbi:gamma-secretase subunit APH-1B [Platysternon megacephalum]|uniref:Gamma-secretase subunit APH-1B n=1 Tax=Platysternon megacephalum TaxID=55544 RepID=A0A4D9EK39_9SAUR|nr:gamma-secretase subunit APH-1B [Platysternon megacephalum]